MKYREEIDGLRAIAVVPVIIFHTGLPGFGGGYVGVDVFFVISGFLITSIILSELEAGRFSVISFYERRARRILPALFVMMFCSIPFAWWLMPPHQLKEYADSLVATTLFSSNFLFWSESGYFDGAAADKPLLHTWSLAIEEQYYIFFPILLSIFWFLGSRKLSFAIGIIALASFAFSAFGFTSDPNANFYLMPSRAWELLAGSILAFIETNRPLHTRLGNFSVQMLSAAGLVMIIYSIVGYNQQNTNSALSTLLPVAGTWILLAFAVPVTFVGKLLSHRWLVSTGLASYSAYLWHQPLLAFVRLHEINAPGVVLFGGIFIATGVLAYLSYRFVEMPFRNQHHFKRRDIFRIALIAAIPLIAIGLIGANRKIGDLRFSVEELAAIDPIGSAKSDCDWHVLMPEFPKVEQCHFGAPGNHAPIILWGDSHAVALVGAADEYFKATGKVGWRVRNRYCQPIVGIFNSRRLSREAVEICEKSQSAMLDVLRSVKPRAIIIAIRWTWWLSPIEGEIDEIGFNNGEGGVEVETYRTTAVLNANGKPDMGAEVKEAAIREFIKNFAFVGAPVLIQYPVPEVGWNVPNLNFKHLVSTSIIPLEISTSASRFYERNAFVIGILDSIVEDSGIEAIKVSEIMCNSFINGRCAAQIKGVPLYLDDDHLSNEGAKFVLIKILEKLH